MPLGVQEILPEAIAIAISPVPVLAIILMLSAARGTIKSVALTAGALAGLVVVWLAVTSLGHNPSTNADGTPQTWFLALQMVLGVLFFAMAFAQFRQRPVTGAPAQAPGWMERIDAASPWVVLPLGVVVVVLLNPKNLSLTFSAAISAAGVDQSRRDDIITLVIFVVVALSTFVAPIIVALLPGEGGDRLLQSLRRFLEARGRTIMVILFVLLGIRALVTAIPALVG